VGKKLCLQLNDIQGEDFVTFSPSILFFPFEACGYFLVLCCAAFLVVCFYWEREVRK
jgi:hypothetical protein